MPPSIVIHFVRMSVETDHIFIMRVFYAYIHTNKPNSRLYTGMTIVFTKHENMN